MGFYSHFVVPRMIEFAARQKFVTPFRQRAAGAARGRILEVGIGSGLNLASYREGVEIVYGIDPSPELLAMARQRCARVNFPVRLLEASSEKLPFDDRSFDTIVMTFTLCSIPDPSIAVRELRRVLKPEGELLFAEHGRSPEPAIVQWQDRLTPLWRRLGGGCHLNRPMDELIRGGGFQIAGLKARYLDSGPRVFSFIYEGSARPT